MKICKKCGVVVKDDAVLLCPECGGGRLKKQPRNKQKKNVLEIVDPYYADVLPEDAGREERKQNNTGLYVGIAFVGFFVAIIVSACAVVAFMM